MWLLLLLAGVALASTPPPPTPSPSPVSDHRFFLHEIFHKYGHDGQMTFEGFEHLLESLGLGNIIIQDHDVADHKEKEFRDTHSSHDHHPTPSPPPTPSSSTQGTPLATSTPASVNHYSLNTIPTPSVGGAPSGEVFRLREAKIPELLVNISTLVDQHQELVDRTPEVVIEQCLSPKEILETFGIDQRSSLNPVSFLHLCPAIIYELDQGHCLVPHQNPPPTPAHHQPTLYQWAYSGLAVLCISLCGLFSVAVIPLMQRRFYHTLLQFLVGLAIGSLSGDALLHLLPHAMLGGHGGGEGDDHSAEKVAVWHGLAALGGVFFFFMAERLLGALANRKSPVPAPDVAEKKLSQYAKNSLELEVNEKEIIKMLGGDGVPPSRKPSVDLSTAGDAPLPKKDSSVVSVEPHGHGHGHSHEVPQSVSAVAWMVIMGDGLHNFCDGLAIGAAFATGVEGGISTTVAVFCHELPHELGDFAVLLRTGMRAREALLYNALSSLLCVAGMVGGVCLGNLAAGWLSAATAGVFLYIALVDMLPELSSPSGEGGAHQLAIQVLGVCCGVSVMFLIANYERDLQNIVGSS